MEALGATASIIAILSLSHKVLKYLNDVKDASKERRACATEVKTLNTLLLKLSLRLDEGSAESQWYTEVQALADKNGPLDQLKHDLELLESMTVEKGRMKKVGDALTWKLKKEESAGILGRMERLKTLIQTALEMDHFKLSQAVKHDTAHIPAIKSDIETMRRGQEAMQQGQETIQQWHDHEKLEKLIAWLSPINYVSQQSDIIVRRQEGTGQWFLDAPQFRTWLRKPKGTLFCPGMPGAGKTVTAAIAVDYLSKEIQSCSIGVAFVYCNYKSHEEQSGTSLLAAILGQLVRAQPSLTKYLEQLRQQCQKPSFVNVLHTLQTVLSIYSTVYVVVDALDEIQDDYCIRRKLINCLRDLQTGIDFRLMVTSRDIPDIVDNFKNALKLEVRATEEDVKRFVAGRMNGLPRCIQRDKSLQDKVQEEIAKAVDGMFLLAQFYVDSLRDKRTPKTVEFTLSQLSRSCGSLDDAYREAVERIRCQLDGDSDLAKKVLSWITYAQRPLTTDELCCALAVEQGEEELDPRNVPDVEDLVSVCAGLVVIDKKSAIIRLVHYTTQEYFERTLKVWNPRVQLEIASTCLTYLSFQTFKVGSCQSPEEFKERVRQNKFLVYAAMHWGKHALPIQDEIRELACSFLLEDGSVACAEQLLCMIYPFEDPSYYRSRGITGLHLIARLGLSSLTQSLLHRLGDEVLSVINKKNPSNFTALYIASQHGHVDIVKSLVDKGADVNAQNSSFPFLTAFEAASSRGCTEIEQLLLKNGAVISTHSSDRILTEATANGRIEIVRRQIEKGANLNLHTDMDSPLATASFYGYEEIVRLLLENGADVNKECSPSTPLCFAVLFGHGKIIKLLIENGADVNKENRSHTALCIAVIYGHWEIVRLLVENGADVNKESRLGTALLKAITNGRTEIARLLIEKGAYIKGLVPSVIMLASSDGSEWQVRLLIKKEALEADIPHIEFTRELALLIASHRAEKIIDNNANPNNPLNVLPENYIRTVRLLVEKGANISFSFNRRQTCDNLSSSDYDEVIKATFRNGDELSKVIEAAAKTEARKAAAAEAEAREAAIQAEAGEIAAQGVEGLCAAAKRLIAIIYLQPLPFFSSEL